MTERVLWLRVAQPSQIMGRADTTLQGPSDDPKERKTSDFDSIVQIGSAIVLMKDDRKFVIPLSNVLCMEIAVDSPKKPKRVE